MTTTEQSAIRSGVHWLCALARHFGTNAAEEIDALQGWNLEAGELALSIMEAATPRDVTRRAMFRIDCWPEEKRLILSAAKGTKVVDFIREAVIEKACRELSERPARLSEMRGECRDSRPSVETVRKMREEF